ncbi:MAG: secretin N-terminal domain-containing protein, partial [Armatimonadota bacterium]|nr:secretin N-terminal domain-containing protein [Armatimonadota bacterium]
PEALAGALRQALPGVTVTSDRTLGALIVQGLRADVERAKAIVATLDTAQAPSPAQLQVEVLPLRYAIPSEFVTEPATSRTADELAQTVQTALQPIYPDLRVTVEKRLQALIVTGTPPALAAARDLVAQLDRPSPQVALEVRVVEVAATALQNLGLSLSPITGTTITEQDPNNASFTFGRTPLSITVILNLLVERGQAKILANPTVATLDGRKALIRTGDDIPLVTRQIFGSTILETVITFRAGVTLEILPKITGDSLITAMLKPVVSTITGTTPQGAPQISTREVQTMLLVRSGETIVLGGLLEERDIVSLSKIPGLGDLPFFGRLFRSERREQRRTELVITVTPRILPTPQPAP